MFTAVLILVLQLSLSAKCYARAVQLDDSIPSGWEDLAMINYLLGKFAKENGGKIIKPNH